MRSALGASRGVLIRQLLVENLALAGAGAAVGILLAQLGVRLLLAMRPDALPRLDAVSIDPMVMGFAALVTLGSAVVFGLLPGAPLRAARLRSRSFARPGATAGLGCGAWLRKGVVVAEVVLSFVLLIGAGLMLRSFMVLQQDRPGLRSQRRADVSLAEPPAQRGPRKPARSSATSRRGSRRCRAFESATVAAPLPLDGGNANARWGPLAAAADPQPLPAGDDALRLARVLRDARRRRS